MQCENSYPPQTAALAAVCMSTSPVTLEVPTPYIIDIDVIKEGALDGVDTQRHSHGVKSRKQAQKWPCKGIQVVFPDRKEQHTSYPFEMHSERSIPWNYKSVDDAFYIQAKSCQKWTHKEGGVCDDCDKLTLSTLMRCRCGSTRGYTHSEDLEPRVRRSGAMGRRTAGVTTCALQPPLRLYPSFKRPHAFSTHSDRPETRQERQARVIQRAHSESERIVTWVTLNITKATLVVFKSLTACVDILELYKRLPQVGLVLVSRPCHVGGRPTSHIALQGPGAGVRIMDSADRSPGAEVLKMG